MESSETFDDENRYLYESLGVAGIFKAGLKFVFEPAWHSMAGMAV